MSFDLLARHYRWMECVLAGGKLQRCRTAFVPETRAARAVLILGEGNGRFLQAFRRVNGAAHVLCVDSSEPMLLQARRRLSKSGLALEGTEFVVADALEWDFPEDAFDLIVTNFFLDCFSREELVSLVEKISKAARSEAAWIISDFQIPPQGLARFRARVIHWLMYLFFRCVTDLSAKRLSDPDAHLVRGGFRLKDRRLSDWDLLRADLWLRR